MELYTDIITELSHGKITNYLKNKKETILNFRNSLSESYSPKKFKNIFSLMLLTEEKEIIHNKEYTSELCVLYNLSMIYNHADNHLKFKLIRIIIYCINKANGKDNFAYVNKIFNCISKKSEVLNRVIDILFNYDRLKEVLFDQYIEENFKSIENASELMKEVDFWKDNSPKVVNDNYYTNNALNKTEVIIRTTYYNDPSVKLLRENFDSIFVSDTYKSKMSKLYRSSEEALLKTISLDHITKEEIKEIAESIKYAESSKATIIKYTNYALNGLKGQSLEKIQSEFYMCEKSDLFVIKKLLRRLLSDSIKEENYALIAFAHTDSDELCIYEKLILYFTDFSKIALYDFIKWSFACGIFRNKRTMTVDKYYIRALKDYILNNDTELLKNRKILRKYFIHEESRQLIDDIKHSTASPLKKVLFGSR